MKHKHYLLAVVVTLCAATTVHAQYLEDSIDVGGQFVPSLAYNSREDVLYGAAYYGGFFAISCDSNKIIKSLALGYPREVAYDSVDNKAWCTIWGADLESLAVIDGATHSLVKKIQMAGALEPIWDPVSNRVYVSCDVTNRVAVVDCVTDSVLKYIPVGASPESMYINTLRRKLYVMNFEDATVSVVDMLTNQVTSTVSLGVNTDVGYYSRCVDKFYCEGPEQQCLAIDGASDAVVAHIPLPSDANYLFCAAGNEPGGLVYVSAYSGDTDYVATISAFRDSVVAVRAAGRVPCGLAYSGRNDRLYCEAAVSNQLTVLTGDGTQVLRSVPLGDWPSVTALVPRHGRLYVGCENTRYVYVVRDTTLGVGESPGRRPGSSWVPSTAPNPFMSSVAVAWSPSLGSGGTVRVYAQDGRMVRQARIPAGETRWVWDGRDDSGVLLPPGVYVIEAAPGLRAKVVKLK